MSDGRRFTFGGMKSGCQMSSMSDQEQCCSLSLTSCEDSRQVGKTSSILKLGSPCEQPVCRGLCIFAAGDKIHSMVYNYEQRIHQQYCNKLQTYLTLCTHFFIFRRIYVRNICLVALGELQIGLWIVVFPPELVFTTFLINCREGCLRNPTFHTIYVWTKTKAYFP